MLCLSALFDYTSLTLHPPPPSSPPLLSPPISPTPSPQIALLALPFGEYVDAATPEAWLRRLQDPSFRPVLPSNLPRQLRDAMTAGWHPDPLRRCSSAELVSVLEAILGVPQSYPSSP